ncbi:receptor-like protein kinase FERONIA [Aegilops tauschii subsp. strangulata]|uniref:receptor-like protein kinase FERONIA n=1 Tax=Aegilops tauschii subsp. strangulata TaxID=200361 RepID=UPI003CC88DC9
MQKRSKTAAAWAWESRAARGRQLAKSGAGAKLGSTALRADWQAVNAGATDAKRQHGRGGQRVRLAGDAASRAAGVDLTPQSLTSNLCFQFSLSEMKSATRNFDESYLIGHGGSGRVYYGMIDGGATKMVAIKRGRVEEDVSKFQTEIAMTAKLHHHHLVSLMGYCKEENELILIYDYMARGTLRGNLYANNTKEPPLTWRQRLDVCIGVARALHYLHECSIIHNDVSTTNILLDERLVGKIPIKVYLPQDNSHVSTQLLGSIGFFDPEYLCTGQLTEKSNVYSFGVVLFEVLCARAAYDYSLSERQANLVYCALSCQKKGILNLIVDPYLLGKIAPRCFKKFVEIAEKCVSDRGIDRPTMREVFENLELCLAEQSGSLGDEMLGVNDTNGPSRTERLLNLEMYLAEDDGINLQR